MILAQHNPSSMDIFKWALALVALVFVGFLLVAWMRKRLTSHEEEGAGGFTLSDLRELHKSGKISTEEFERAKARMVAAVQAAARRKENEKKKD